MERVSNNKDNVELIAEYLGYASDIDLSERTIENYNSCLKIFARVIDKPLMDVDISDLVRFKRHLEKLRNRYSKSYSPKTICRYFSALQSFYEFLELKEHIDKNPMPKFSKIYLKRLRKKTRSNGSSNRKLISIEEMSMLINSVIDPRDKAVIMLLAKTGIRRQECKNIDIDDIDWVEQCIHLKPTPKRTCLKAFFDDECSRVLKRWMISRENRKNNGTKALFLNERGGRLGRNAIYELVVKHATKVGLHNPNSHRPEDRFTTHCTRHWNCTHLRRKPNQIQREHLKKLRGDAPHEAVDIYLHIDDKELRDEYLRCIPQLGVD